MKRYVFTCGDINGIGPEIALRTINIIKLKKNEQVVFICPGNVLTHVIKFVGTCNNFKTVSSISELENSIHNLVHFDTGNFRITPGKPTIQSGKASIKSLDLAVNLINEKAAGTIITAPISKEAVKKAGFKFPGHTEYFAATANTKKFAMMFVSRNLRCSLITIHEPIRRLGQLLTKELIQEKVEVIIYSLRKDFNISSPKIAVLGFNPHAGENGSIGTEENDIIAPALRKFGKRVNGPFVSDAFFGRRMYKEYDCVIGMYHDQVLIPFKMLDFTTGVNFTAGLSFIRTSPDHGTAYDIAWKNGADNSSMLAAYKLACTLTKNRYGIE
ncbi:MAG: 4-hydroxythreonine-4-phosphate dehydrogenase PdxA [Melioribacteraceae bacterium]|nr:4-hydroxythreonine-4-phosphate dehydrogenase PdxA [Melioribacteraceae bacterium]